MPPKWNAGLSVEDAEVDQPRRDHEPLRIDHLRVRPAMSTAPLANYARAGSTSSEPCALAHLAPGRRAGRQ
jgi:hypothetical protein